MLNEKTMHAGIGGCEASLLGSYTKRGNESRDLDPPWGIKDMVAVEIRGELSVSCKIPRQSAKA